MIAYDIACPRRWRRLYRLVRQHGVRVQWSVFVVVEARFRPEAFLSAAAKIIDPKRDDLRLYQVSGKITGPPLDTGMINLPDGIHWWPGSARPRARRPGATVALDTRDAETQSSQAPS